MLYQGSPLRCISFQAMLSAAFLSPLRCSQRVKCSSIRPYSENQLRMVHLHSQRLKLRHSCWEEGVEGSVQETRNQQPSQMVHQSSRSVSSNTF